MLALSLFLTAAAGVNAMVGREVSAVKISEELYLCADDCAHEGVFFAQKGYFCPENETIINVKVKANRDFLFYDCTGSKPGKGFTQRERLNGEAPYGCDIRIYDESGEAACPSFRSGDGKAGKTVQWSDVEKELKSATPEGGESTPEENPPAAPKSQQQCDQIGREIFAKCRQNSGEFIKCDEQARGAIRNCLGQA